MVIHNGQLIDSDETNKDSLDVNIQPIALVNNLTTITWQPSYYLLADDVKDYL
jgi:hypothetical protein